MAKKKGTITTLPVQVKVNPVDPPKKRGRPKKVQTPTHTPSLPQPPSGSTQDVMAQAMLALMQQMNKQNEVMTELVKEVRDGKPKKAEPPKKQGLRKGELNGTKGGYNPLEDDEYDGGDDSRPPPIKLEARCCKCGGIFEVDPQFHPDYVRHYTKDDKWEYTCDGCMGNGRRAKVTQVIRRDQNSKAGQRGEEYRKLQ